MNDNETVAAARRALDGFMKAMNAEDIEDVRRRWFHFPHVRFQAGKVFVWNAPDDFQSPVLARQGEAKDWARTEWDYAEPIDFGPEKVHFRAQFTRYRADGSVIGSYKSLYIVVQKDGRWAIQGRSTWAVE